MCLCLALAQVDEALLLLEDLQRLQEDLTQLQGLADVFTEIMALASVREFQDLLADMAAGGDTNANTVITRVICGTGSRGSFGQAINPAGRRRSAAPFPDADITAGERRRREEMAAADTSTAAPADDGIPGGSLPGGEDDPLETLSALLGGAKIYYSPDVPEVREVIRAANRTIEELATIEALVSCVAEQAGFEFDLLGGIASGFSLDFWQGFPDEFSMVKASMGLDNLATVIGGIAFQG